LLIIISFTSLFLSAENTWIKASLATFDFGDSYGEWEICNLDIKIDTEQKKLLLFINMHI